MLITICCVFGAEAAASVLEPDGPVPPGTAACIVFLDPVDPAAEADLVGLCGGAAIGSGTSSTSTSSMSSSSCGGSLFSIERLRSLTRGGGGGGMDSCSEGRGAATWSLRSCNAAAVFLALAHAAVSSAFFNAAGNALKHCHSKQARLAHWCCARPLGCKVTSCQQ